MSVFFCSKCQTRVVAIGDCVACGGEHAIHGAPFPEASEPPAAAPTNDPPPAPVGESKPAKPGKDK